MEVVVGTSSEVAVVSETGFGSLGKVDFAAFGDVLCASVLVSAVDSAKVVET